MAGHRFIHLFIYSQAPAAPAAPKVQKKIRTFMTALPSGDTGEFAPVANHDEAIPMARSVAGISADSTIMIVKPEPERTMTMCGQGIITLEMMAVKQTTKTQLNLIPGSSEDPKSVMVKVIYHHIDEHRKPARASIDIRVQSDEQERDLLERWMREAIAGRTTRETWRGRARVMSKKATDYVWPTGERNELVKPLYDLEITFFMDPQRPPFEKKSRTAADGTSSGTNGSPDRPDQSGPAGPSSPPGLPGGSSPGSERFGAPKYTSTTRSSKRVFTG
jgi:hypothetical protein